MKDYRDFGIEIPYGRTSGNVKTYCPQCRDQRSNKHDKSLSVDLNKGVWNCHYCGWASGLGADEDEKKQWMQRQPWFNPRPLKREKPVYKKPQHTGKATMSSKALAWFAGRKISQKTLEQMRVTEGMEWMPQKEGQANTIQFNYYHNGELVNTKYRTGDKCFKLCQGAELLPYNIDAIKGTKECIITEGEVDTLSFVECGRFDVISVPNGANANLAYLDDYIEEYFDDKETIFIASDTDTKGVILRDELLRRFGAERCRILEYGEGCKDANEHLMKFGRESLLQCLANAPEVKIEGIFTVSDFEQSLDAIFEHGLQKGVTIGLDNFDRLCSFETKRLCIVTGIPGCLAGDTLVSMADGTQKPITDIQVGDMVVSYTKDYQRTIKEVVTKWISGKKEVLQLNLRNGMSVQPTPKHKFLTFDGWKPAGEIKEGDFLLVAPTAEGNDFLVNRLSCRWEEVKSIERIGVVDTYDLEVQDTHNYFASNILVSNSGKSEFIDEIAECLNMRYGWRFAYFSPENAPLAYHASKLIEKFTGKRFSKDTLKYGEYKQVKGHLEQNFYFISPADNFKIDTILEKAKFLVRRRGIKALVIDPYNRLESQQGNRNETQYISELLDKLTNFAQINDILVVLMAHPTKQPKNKDGVIEAPTLYDISGSANFYNKADFGIVVHRNRIENLVEVHVQKVKFRHLGEVGMCKFKYNLNNGRYTPYNGEMTINWDNTNHLQEHKRQEEQEAYERSIFDFHDNDIQYCDYPF